MDRGFVVRRSLHGHVPAGWREVGGGVRALDGPDAAFALEIADEARRYGVRVVEVDGSLPADATAEVVRQRLGLLREANGRRPGESRRNVASDG